MKCVYFDNQRPDSFEEQFSFSRQMPYSVQVKHFTQEDIVPLHYGNTLEILLCDHLDGGISIDSQLFPFHGQQIFVIPPRTVHATTIRPCSGTQYVVKVHFEAISYYFDVEHFLESCSCHAGQFAYHGPAYTQIKPIVDDLIANDGQIPRCLISILELLHILSQYTDKQRDSMEIQTQFKSSTLRELVNWTHRNYMRRISIDDAAAVTGYSKYHFCTRFKAMTGMTYIQYLNSVRVSYACRMLSNGESVQTVCREVGFDNLSYFIQLFKRLRHITPYRYAIQHKNGS